MVAKMREGASLLRDEFGGAMSRLERKAVSALSWATALAVTVVLTVGLGACSGSSGEEGAGDGPSTVAQAQGAADAASGKDGAAKSGAHDADQGKASSADATAGSDTQDGEGNGPGKAGSAGEGVAAGSASDNASGMTATVPEISEGSSFSVAYFDVGQGDSALVQCDGAYLLIDGGPPEASSLLYSALTREGIDFLNYVVVTHPDTDHSGGVAGAAGRAFCSVTQANQRSFNAMVERLSSQNVALEVPEVGDSFQLGSALVQVIGPVDRTDDGDANNDSIMLKITYGTTVFVFAGDADSNEEKGAAAYLDGCDVLKVAHHGSAGSSCYAFLRAALPKNVVISCSADNSYGHPADAALSRLRDCGAAVYRTDMQGDIVAESDGTTVTVTPARNADVDTLVAGPGGGLGASAGGSAASGSGASGDTNGGAAGSASGVGVSGGSASDSASGAESASDQGSGNDGSSAAGSYIGNVNSKKFHLPTCSTLPAEHNRVYFDTRDEAMAAGMTPCKRCNP